MLKHPSQVNFVYDTRESNLGERQFTNFYIDTISVSDVPLKLTARYPAAPIFHYGSYEKKVIRELGTRHKTEVKDITSRLYNINEYIFGRIYFPERNRN